MTTEELSKDMLLTELYHARVIKGWRMFWETEGFKRFATGFRVTSQSHVNRKRAMRKKAKPSNIKIRPADHSTQHHA